MNRTRVRLAGFAAVLAVLFGVGAAAGAQFPTDEPAHAPTHDDPTPVDPSNDTDPEMDHEMGRSGPDPGAGVESGVAS